MKSTEQSVVRAASTPDSSVHPSAVSTAGVDIGAFHEALLSSAPVTVYYMSPDGTIRYANPAFRRMFDLKPEQTIEEWRCGLHPDDRAALERHWDDFNRNPRPCHVQFRTQDSSGAVRHLIETVVAASGIAGFIGTITDVTDLVEARDQLHQMAALHRGMFEQVPTGIAYSTRSGELLSCNPAFSRMLGYSSEQIEGKPIRQLIHPDDIDQSLQEFARLWSGAINDYTLDKRYLKKDGSPLWVRVTVALVRDATGEPICTVGFIEDLSTRKQTELALQQSNEGLEAANRQLRYLATHDTLTGLPNRVLLEDRVQQAIAHADRNRAMFALLVCDLDRFKLINDSMGHRAGDRLLQEVAHRLVDAVRSIDTVARLGGDEFVVVLSSITGRADAESAAQRALLAFNSPVVIDGVDIHIAPSIGIAFYPDDGTTIDALMAHADAAMYCAKQGGRSKVQQFTADMIKGVSNKLKLEGDLRRALSLHQFELYYQPKVQLSNAAVKSAEALIRWRHPERGLLSPSEFIPIAEDCGLIGDISAWVLGEATRQMRLWQQQDLQLEQIAVNLSASDLRGPQLQQTIRGALLAAGLEAKHLEVEITESVLMSNPEESIAVLQQLRSMGLLIAVDDFGSGYSSMNYLRRLPIDKLKIDRTFIKELTARADDASIVQAIVSMAHSLKLQVIAEGVETIEQLIYLKALGCDRYQGFLFSRPLPPAAFERLIRHYHATGGRSVDETETTSTRRRLVRLPGL
jgi:diguanylate cyclase (GGDEF)-like protein/PAS domain S-box-containing protein